MKLALPVLLLSLVLVFALGEGRAAGYQVVGYKWDHSPTYSCDPLLRQAIQEWALVSGLEDAGCSATPEIELRVISPWPHERNVLGVTRLFTRDGVTLGFAYIDVPPDYFYGVLLHESGHALGLMHSSDQFPEPNPLLRDAALYHYCCNPMNADDIAGMQYLYGPEPEPPVFRVFLAGLAN